MHSVCLISHTPGLSLAPFIVFGTLGSQPAREQSHLAQRLFYSPVSSMSYTESGAQDGCPGAGQSPAGGAATALHCGEGPPADQQP